MSGIAEFINAQLDKREAKARALMGDTPGRWIAAVDEHHEYVEVLGAIREGAQPGDGYWYSVCSWNIAAIASDSGSDDFDDIERDCLAEAEHMAANDPATVLADIESKRRILDEVVDEATGLDMQVDNGFRIGPRDEAAEPYLGDILLRLLAAPFSGEPGYDRKWAV